MKSILLLFSLLFFLPACAPDDQNFDLSALSPRHRLQFEQAGNDLNRSEPNAVFVFDNPQANSSAYYGETNPDAQATTYTMIIGLLGWQIAFQPSTMDFSDDCLYWISVHELKHVLRYDHVPGNPYYYEICIF